MRQFAGMLSCIFMYRSSVGLRRQTTVSVVRSILDHFHQFCRLAFSPGGGIMVSGFGRDSLSQDFQEQKSSSAAFVPLEIPR